MVIDGIYYAVGSLIGGALTAWLTGQPLSATPFFVFGVFCLYFFRDPERQSPEGPYVLSPADGKVMVVKPDQPSTTRVSIFLNVFDVHVNRSPVAGTITGIEYKKGEFLVASKELASADNEQNLITVRTPDGVQVRYKQIAGLIARRLVFKKKVGDTVAAGERIGLMKFGSRMDLLLGPEWKIQVKAGDRVIAGTSILAVRI
ncbi:MAG: phosphatidylserine decarboxylase [Bryobacteraceae bacterium]